MLHHTENATTVTVGQCTATVIADTISPTQIRIITIEAVYPRYIHSEVMTHRAFSRNASSSRATPLSIMLKEVETDPVFFDYVGLNKSGMVAGAEIDPITLEDFRTDWENLGQYVAARIRRMSDLYGVHKQTLNRALEPWSRIRTLITATEWQNFFDLRLAPDAQPEIRSLALAIKGAMERSKPIEGTVHLPYSDNIYSAVASCARVSYGRLNGKETDKSADYNLYTRLLDSGHMSPFEHIAFCAHGKHANLNEWESLRTRLDR